MVFFGSPVVLLDGNNEKYMVELNYSFYSQKQKKERRP